MKEFVQRLDSAYQEIEELVRDLTDEELSSEVSGGWTRAAVLGHLAAWHDASTYRLYRFEASGREQDVITEDMDAFNALVASESRGRSADQLRASLARSFARLREALVEVSVMTDDLDWAMAMVEGNTVGHYGEHVEDLRLH